MTEAELILKTIDYVIERTATHECPGCRERAYFACQVCKLCSSCCKCYPEVA